ncbi:MAG: hypothetical protein A2Y16_05515 [Tenericutes bacterium GWF2_57_13]|nr:MAG: hypothetical protein A2Y16_05515 [Tenericutes bacterium GWF2_57_13]
MIRNKKNIVFGPQDPITNEVHRLMIWQPYRWYQVKDISMIVFGEYNESHDTAIREAIRRVRLNADWFCLVLSSRKGYKVAESRAEYKAWRGSVIEAFNTDLDVLELCDWKSIHDENLRMTDTEYQCPVYESIKDAPPIPQLQPPITYNIQTNGQVSAML